MCTHKSSNRKSKKQTTGLIKVLLQRDLTLFVCIFSKLFLRESGLILAESCYTNRKQHLLSIPVAFSSENVKV